MPTSKEAQHQRLDAGPLGTAASAERPVPPPESTLAWALRTWHERRTDPSEEFWQLLFEENPLLFAPLARGRDFDLKSQCYVGGKTLDNTGGNIVDFLARHRGNVTLIEIKTPMTPLMGTHVRENAYTASAQLNSAVAQAQSYRESLMNNVYALRSQSPDFYVHDPKSYVLIGDTEREALDDAKRGAFERYRHGLKDVEILTYDELFRAIAQLAPFFEPHSENPARRRTRRPAAGQPSERPAW